MFQIHSEVSYNPELMEESEVVIVQYLPQENHWEGLSLLSYLSLHRGKTSGDPCFFDPCSDEKPSDVNSFSPTIWFVGHSSVSPVASIHYMLFHSNIICILMVPLWKLCMLFFRSLTLISISKLINSHKSRIWWHSHFEIVNLRCAWLVIHIRLQVYAMQLNIHAISLAFPWRLAMWCNALMWSCVPSTKLHTILYTFFQGHISSSG